jgi:hypothetical protein
LKYVAWLIPAFRQISATGTPSSPCFGMNAFWTPENCDAFIVFRSLHSQENAPENSNQNWSSLKGSDHSINGLGLQDLL